MRGRYYNIKFAKLLEQKCYEKYKLNICNIHPDNYGVNVRSYYEQDWKNISKYVRSYNHNKCEYCGYKQNLHCHEEWRYDDIERTQYLKSLHSVCALCHASIHPGANEHFKIYENDIIKKHFMFINKMDEQSYIEYIHIKIDLALYRSKFKYDLDIKSINNIIIPILKKINTEIIL